MNWKKEITSWGAILAVFAFLYFSGLLPVIQGALQSVLLATGLMKPSIEVPDLTDQKFDYRGQFTDFKGNTIDLQSYRGKTLFINLWASWCGPCRALGPVLEGLKNDFAGKATFIEYDVDNSPEESQQYNVTSIPVVIIERDGVLVERFQGLSSKMAYVNAINEGLK